MYSSSKGAKGGNSYRRNLKPKQLQSARTSIPEMDKMQETGSMGGDTHRSTHAGVKQDEGTVFKINADEWNNVAEIVYDAVCTLVTRFDANVALQRAVKEEHAKELRSQHKLHEVLERAVEENQSRLIGAVEGAKKHFAERLKHVQIDFTERNARLQTEAVEVARAADGAVAGVQAQEATIEELK